MKKLSKAQTRVNHLLHQEAPADIFPAPAPDSNVSDAGYHSLDGNLDGH